MQSNVNKNTMIKIDKISLRQQRTQLVMRGLRLSRCLLLMGASLFSVFACSSSQHKDDDSGDAVEQVKIDCEQEANKYRKPCRSNRW